MRYRIQIPWADFREKLELISLSSFIISKWTWQTQPSPFNRKYIPLKLSLNVLPLSWLYLNLKKIFTVGFSAVLTFKSGLTFDECNCKKHFGKCQDSNRQQSQLFSFLKEPAKLIMKSSTLVGKRILLGYSFLFIVGVWTGRWAESTIWIKEMKTNKDRLHRSPEFQE